MKLNLKNPLIFFDLETTGTDITHDRIVEISMVKVHPNGDEEIKTRRVNPNIHIPAEATAIHGISDADVAGEPVFEQIAKSLASYIEGCDLAGFNSNRFDIPLLAEEFARAGVDVNLRKRKAVDVQNIFHKKEQRTLSAAYKFYCGQELENAHSAQADTLATYKVLQAQLDLYPDLQNDIAFLDDYTRQINTADYAGRIGFDKNGAEIILFGKHKGRCVEDVFREEPSYYAWIMNGDFPLFTKKVFTEIRLRMK